MRGFRLLVVLSLAASAALGAGPAERPALAQGQPGVVLRLGSQSPWNGAKRPLHLAFAAMNGTSQPLTQLSVVLSIGTPTLTRSQYELSLRTDQTAFPFAVPFQFSGALEAGATRTFSLSQPLTTYPQPVQSGLYPIKIQLLANNVPVATLRTAMIFLVERPKTPLNLTWTWVLDAPLQQAPDGTFLPGALPAAIAPGGWLDGMVSALDQAAPAPADVVVSPLLVAQLAAMARGYRVRTGTVLQSVRAGTDGAADASRILAALRRVAGNDRVELVATPFGDARIPSLLRSGLAGDVGHLLVEGRARVSSILGAPPSMTVFWPQLSQIEPSSAAAVSNLGVRVLLVDQNTVPLDTDLPFSPPAGSARSVVELGTSPPLWAITPDRGVGAVAAASADDPRLAAQVALGELAAIWLEFPGTPGRGAAVAFPGTLHQYGPAFFGAFAQLVHGSPWLQPERATDLVGSVSSPPSAQLPARSFRAFSPTYRRSLTDVRRALAEFDGAVHGAPALVSHLNSTMLQAEGDVGLSNQHLGLALMEFVRQTIDATYRRIRPSGSPFTLTSKGNFSLPLVVSNEGPYSLHVAVRLVSDRRLLFPRGNVREVTLPAKRATLVKLLVQAEATGRFPVKVQILTAGADGQQALIAERFLIIHSTAYNRIALLLTIGAAAFLLAWWGRRFVPGRRPPPRPRGAERAKA